MERTVQKLADKVIIVTGGGKGIGAAFTEALAGAGAKVVIADIADGTAVAQKIGQAGGTASYIRTDVSARASVEELVAATLERHGRIDGLVNNAALFATLTKKPFTEIDEAEWDKVMAVNVRGPFLCAKAVAPIMTAQKSGKIVSIASGTVFKGVPGLLHYVASKGAVVAMTRCLARELGPHNIGVNAIAPGLTLSEGLMENTEWQKEGSAGTVATRAFKRDQMPADLIGAMLFFCSNDSDFVTGQTLVVDGGAVMR
jgi:NAD(P)-dependent dehydrogenase (short-subunit alcohol dehydrogenase family)